MASEDSDDEPLSVLASSKNRIKSEIEILPVFEPFDASMKIPSLKKECDVSIKIQPSFHETPVVERPTDVWLYLTDFNVTGPYSCLLCSEWFINRNRIVIHYVVDHKKDYCGICRYFVLDREAWQEHQKFHLPWKCSQCEENFDSQIDLRDHFSSAHNLVHCRLCSLRLSDDEQYHNHLYQKHCVTKVQNIYDEILWNLICKGNQKFLCLLCSKTINVGRQFADHFLSYHHLTLKCFMFLISGVGLPFSIKGVELTPEFIETQLKAYRTFGYVDFMKSLKCKQEPVTIIENVQITVDCDPNLREFVQDGNFNDEEETKINAEIRRYKGNEDFDVTLMEVIIMHKCYYDYVNEILKEIDSNVMPHSSEINYANVSNKSKVINCCLCEDVFSRNNPFETHMTKMHNVKSLPVYCCRVCATVFDSLSELETHCSEEMGDFEDLWICQFCDKEFNGRKESRKHLTEHWSLIEYDNCFSPHLGFKCKFCPTLFWNETDRESHHVRVHAQKHKSDFYKCLSCGEMYGDKAFFIHHYIEKHYGNKPQYLLKCCICCVVFENVEEIRSHFDADHPKAKKMFCSLEQCKYKPFSQKKTLLFHLKTIHDPANRSSRSVTCNTCGLDFNNAKACSIHTTLKHGPGKFKCTICDDILHTNDERKIHYLIRHPGRYQYQCPSCDKSFQYKSSLYMHKQEHSPNKKDYTCTYCAKTFSKRDSYREHIMIHEAPRHACSYCPMRFVQRSNMLRHERRHTGERPYSCKFCPRTFADKGACTSHSRTHLKNTSYACVYCGQTFVQKSKLTYHIRKHTGENLETCPACSKIFTSACSLREHMRIHQRDKMKKTIKCPLCTNMYSDERDMMRHMRTTHTGAQFKCPLCRKTVGSASSLREHVLTHSRVKTYRCTICPKSYHSKKSIIRHLQIRHFLKPPITPTHYVQLDPKDCDLGLEDEVMNKIFGNVKKRRDTDVLMGNFVTFNKGLQINPNAEQNRVRDPSDGNDSDDEVTEEHIEIKLEPADETDEEVPPPDFVNVKIECVDEGQRSDTDSMT